MPREYPCWSLLRPSNSHEKLNKVVSAVSSSPNKYYVDTYIDKVRKLQKILHEEIKIDIPSDIYKNIDFNKGFISEIASMGLCVYNTTHLSSVVTVTLRYED